MNTRFIVLDTETSGLPPEAGVCEIGWLELDSGANWLSKVDSLIDPEYPICPSASGVHGLVDEDVQGCPTLAEFFSVDDPSCYGKRIQADRVIFIGHKASFDRHFVEPYIDGEILEVDTLRWARQMYPQAPDHKLSTLKFLLGLRKDAGEAHRVMADVWVTYDLLLHILQRTGYTLEELAEKSKEPMLLHTMSFGKHRGQPFHEIPRSYINWALNNLTDLDQDLRFTLEHYYHNTK